MWRLENSFGKELSRPHRYRFCTVTPSTNNYALMQWYQFDAAIRIAMMRRLRFGLLLMTAGFAGKNGVVVTYHLSHAPHADIGE